MKKCICISCFDHYSTRMQSICNFFLSQGYDTRYIYAGFDHYSKSKNNHVYEYGVKIKVPAYNKNLSLQRLLSHVVFSSRVTHYVEKNKPDIIYCMIPPNTLVKKLAKYKKRDRNIKLIFDCYDLWPESFPYTIQNKIIEIPFRIWGNLRKKNISTADLVIGVSEQQLIDLRPELCDTPARIIKPTIITGEIPQYKTDVVCLDFCYLGMVNHIIDMDLAVDLLGKIAERKRVRLHIIGAGENLDEFTLRLKSVSVEVIQHGVVFDMSKKNAIFSLCNWGLNIPREEINSTMSLKAVEYLRAGLPMINNALGDIRSIVEQNNLGINIDKRDLKTTVEMILSLTDNDMKKMHSNVLKSYMEFFAKQDLAEILKV